MSLRFSDFCAFVIAAAFVTAVFVAPYIMAWHYLDSHFSRMAEHDSRPRPSTYHPTTQSTPRKAGATFTQGDGGEPHRPLNAGRALGVTDRRDGHLEHSLRVSIRGSGLPRPGILRSTMGRERGASAQAFEDVPPQFLSPLLAASHLCSVDAPLLASLVQRESEWKADAVSSAGAIGLGQLMPRTAKAMRIDPWVPEQNLIGAACHLRSMLDRYKGDERRALIAYHRGAWAKGPTPQASHDYAADIIQGSAQ